MEVTPGISEIFFLANFGLENPDAQGTEIFPRIAMVKSGAAIYLIH